MFNYFLITSRLAQTSRKYISMSANLRQQLRTYAPNGLEKRFLVWTGKYKTVTEVPNLVSHEVMERCRNRIRIRLANCMILASIIGCITMVISGKRAAERGESVTKQNLDWHKQYNEQHKIQTATTTVNEKK